MTGDGRVLCVPPVQVPTRVYDIGVLMITIDRRWQNSEPFG